MTLDLKDDPDERERLLWSHKYRDAIALDDVMTSIEPWDNRALAHYCLGEFDEGLAVLADAVEAMAKETPGVGNFYCNMMAVGHWCLGDKEEAVELLQAQVSGLLDRSIRYADGSGGTSTGFLLWWMHKRSRNETGVRVAIKYLKNRAKRRKIANWPGPIARYLLNEISEQEMLHVLAEKSFAIELLNRRYMANALFYMAAKRGDGGDVMGSRDLLMNCACLENPLIEPEWYLARHELGMDFWWKRPSEQN